MKETTYVHAVKGTIKTKFTEMIWKNMGKFKNGWQLDPEHDSPVGTTAPPLAQSKAVSADLNSAARYKAFVQQGKAAEKAGKWGDAMDRYADAYRLKKTKALEGAMAKVEVKIAAEMTTALNAIETLNEGEANLADADAAYQAGRFGVAKELYAGLAEQTELVKERVAQCEEALSDDLI